MLWWLWNKQWSFEINEQKRYLWMNSSSEDETIDFEI